MSLIFLIGMPAAGKSYWGQQLAAMYHYSYFDLDTLVEESVGMPIPQIFATHDEEYFRRLENETLRSLLSSITSPAIVATGGGTPCFFNNMDLLLTNGRVVYLKADMETLISRLEAQQKDRPLLSGQDLKKRLGELLHIRKPVFEKAHHILQSENISLATFEQIISECTSRQ